MQGQAKSYHLLVVEDDEAVLALLKLQLQGAGYTVSTARHGAAALDQIQTQIPDLVISDILMPELDGFGLCRAIREDAKLTHIPFIFLTAHYLDAEDEQLAKRLGAASYIIKNADQQNLLKAVKAALNNQRTVENSLTLRFPELAELARELHLHRLYAQLNKKVQQLVHSEANLARSEARYSSILESAPDSIVVSDQHGRITLVNQQAELLFGYSRKELIGSKVELLVGSESASRHRAYRNNFLASQQLRLEKRRPLGLPVRCKNGDIIPVEINLGSLNDGGEITVTAIIRDIRERLKAEQKILHLNRVYQLLSQCNQALVKASAETDLLKAFCRNIVDTGGYAMAWVGYAKPGISQAFQVVAEIDSQHTIRVARTSTCDRSCPACQVITKGKVLLCDPKDLDSSQKRCMGFAANAEICHSIALPLADRGSVFGVLVIHAAIQVAFDDAEELRLLNELVSDLSYGIITLRREVARQQAEAVLHLRERALDAARNGIFLVNVLADDDTVVYVNPAFSRITGYELEDLNRGWMNLLFRQDTEQTGLRDIRLALRHRTATEAVLRNYRKDNSLFWNEIRISPVPDERGEITHFVGVINDISERMAYQKSLEHRSNHDPLTQLPNRNLLNDRLEQVLLYSRRHQHKSAVLVVDLDRFKTINDSQGHTLGDRLICVMATRLMGLVREGDTVSRWGGDEFVLILPDIENRQQIAGISSKILAEVAKPVELEQLSLTISCSVGCSVYPDDGGSASTLLKYADAAMYRAKELGGNRLQFFEQAFNLAAQARFNTESALRLALDTRQLVIHYQPVIHLATGTIRSAEALVRWNHPQKGLIPPSEFIPVAEECGLIVDIGNQVLDNVCRQLKIWQEQGLALDSVAINVAAKQFAIADMHSTLALRVAAAGLTPAAIEIELTETVLIQDQHESHENLRLLQGSGFSLSLDDFGTGYSSLNYLRRFPVNRIKIDQSFIRDLTTDNDCASLVLTILQMAKTFHCEVIAEGVETEAQLEFLKLNGCDYVQGFYFSPALPADEFEQLVRAYQSKPGVL
ncbi:MAG: EAL domain-containing protein [Motiliproteus sp.]